MEGREDALSSWKDTEGTREILVSLLLWSLCLFLPGLFFPSCQWLLESILEGCRGRLNKLSHHFNKKITKKAHVADQTGLAEAVRAINNRAVAQVRKYARTFFEVKGAGRLKKFTGKEEDVQQWSKKTFSAGVVKESETILERSTEQVITMEHAELEFTPPTSNVYGGVVNLEFVLQQTHAQHLWLTSYEANDIVANSRKKPLKSTAKTAGTTWSTDRRKKTKLALAKWSLSEF